MHMVIGNTFLFSSQGYIDTQRASMCPHVLLWTGEKFEEFTVSLYKPCRGIYNIMMENGMKLTCHASSLWHTKRGLLQSSDLLKGDYVLQHLNPCLDVYGEVDMINDVPLNHTTKFKIGWLQHIFAHSSCNIIQDKNTMVACIFSYDICFVRTVQLMLTTLNIESSTEFSDTEPCVLSVNAENVVRLANMGVHTHSSPCTSVKHSVRHRNSVLAIRHVAKLGIESWLYKIEPRLQQNENPQIVCNGICV